MADTEELTSGARFQSQVPAAAHANSLKGAGALDWGMQSRLARVFRPATNRTVMLAIDHGYFQGPTTGLERVDLSIVPLLGYADALMTTRGMVRSTIPATTDVPIVLRASGGPSVLREMSNEQVAVAMDDALRDSGPACRCWRLPRSAAS
jgi:putative autoinducer-2 (AI-2) aldolase